MSILQKTIRSYIKEERYEGNSKDLINVDYAFSPLLIGNSLPIYFKEVTPHKYDIGFKRDLYSKKYIPLYHQGDSLLYLTNIRTFQQEQSKQYEMQVAQAISDARDELKGKYFKVRKAPSLFCKKYKLGLFKTENSVLKEASFKPIPCMSWTCPECGPYKALRVKYELIDITLLNNLSYFLTLTLDPKHIPSEYTSETHQYITKLFNHFVTTIKRKKFRYYDKRKRKWCSFDLKNQDEKLKYIWVCEFQKNGNAHLHILLNQYLPVQVLRDIWVHVGGGHVMKIEKIKTLAGISMYLTNYIVKGLKDSNNSLGFKYFERRYSVSRSCKRTKNNAEPLITIPHASAIEILYALEQVGLGWSRPFLYNLSKDSHNIYFNSEGSESG